MIESERADIFVPCGVLRFAELRLEDAKSWFAFAREDYDFVALHCPVIGEVKNVVWRADDYCVEVLLGHRAAEARPFFAIEWVGHFVAALTAVACPFE